MKMRAGQPQHSWIDSVGVLPHFAEDDPSPEAQAVDNLMSPS